MNINVKNIFKRAGVMIENDHFVYTSKRHGRVYFDKDRIYIDTSDVSEVCKAIMRQIPSRIQVDVVVAPAVGAVILGQSVAMSLNSRQIHRAKSVFARKGDDGSFVFKGSYPKEIEGKKIWVVEDVLNTGASAKKVIEATRDCGGIVQGLSVLCNQGNLTAQDFDVEHLFSLIEVETWPGDNCLLCKEGIPVNTKVEHGAKFLAEQGL